MKAPPAGEQSTVSPFLVVESIQEELEFLKAVFGADVIEKREEGAGTVWQVEVLLGNATLMIGRGTTHTAPTNGMLYVWTEDVDGTYRRAVDCGATLISAPTDQPTGVREAGFRDPQGNIWWIGKRVKKRLSNREVEQRLTEQRRKRL
jgi:PhnB protein